MTGFNKPGISSDEGCDALAAHAAPTLRYRPRAGLQALAGAFPTGRLRMASSKQLRERAARFLAMAQHQGDTAPAELLTVKAANYMDEAASAEASDAPPPG